MAKKPLYIEVSLFQSVLIVAGYDHSDMGDVSLHTGWMPSEEALKSMSDEDLKALEGMERANVEARIALLRNVQKLLDAAVTKLNQYSTIMAAMG